MRKTLLSLSLAALGLIPATGASLSMEKIRHTIGEGENLYVCVLNFNNDTRLDNLVVGYRTDASTVNAVEVLKALAATDSRLEVSETEGVITAVKFDLNGDKVFDAKDAVAENSADASWQAAVNGKVITFNYSGPTEAPYYFYLPAADEKGVWVPEEMTVKLSDEGFVLPVLVQPQGDAVKYTTNWQASSSNDKYALDRKIIVTPYSFVDDTYNARPTFVGATGTTYVRYRPQIGGTYIESNFMTLTVEAPEVPVTVITVAQSEIESGLNQVVNFEYDIEPENATYTNVTFASSDTKIATWSAAAGLKSTKTAGTATTTAK